MMLMSILMMAAFSLLGVAVRNGWTLLYNRLSRNDDPDQQKLVRARAWTALAALGGAALILVWFLVNGLLSLTAAFIDRQYALYIGLALLFVGTTILRMSARLPPQKRRTKLALALVALGGLLAAYGMGYF